MKCLALAVVLASSMARAQVFPVANQGPPPIPPPLHPPPSQGFFGISIGTGTGIIGGETDSLEADVATGFQWSPMHLRVELGAFRSARYALAIPGRLGFPLTVDVGDPPTAKSVLLRVYRFEGPLRFNVSAGAGYLRYAVGVDGTSKDVMTAGPILGGGGAGYVLRISKSWHLTADVNMLAAIKHKDRYDGVDQKHALHFDLDVGLVVYR